MALIKKTLNLPKELLEEAVKITGATTQTMAVILGLEEIVRRKKLETLMKLKGKGLVNFNQHDLKRFRGR